MAEWFQSRNPGSTKPIDNNKGRHLFQHAGIKSKLPCSEKYFPCFLSEVSLFRSAGNLIESGRNIGGFQQ